MPIFSFRNRPTRNFKNPLRTLKNLFPWKRNKDDNLWSSVVCLICLSLFLLCNYNLHINTYFCPDLNQLMTNSCFTIVTTSSILSPSNYKLAWKNIGKCYYVLSISMTLGVKHQFLVYKINFGLKMTRFEGMFLEMESRQKIGPFIHEK